MDKVPAVARTGGADDFWARWRKNVHRARNGLRRSGVDYFRGDGSDWIALAGLLLTIPAITFATVLSPVWIDPAALALPIVAGGLLLRPASLLGLYATAAGALILEALKLGPYLDGPARVTPGTVLVVAACGFFGLVLAQFRARVGVPWRRGGTMLFDLRERIRVQSSLPRLPQGWHREMALRPAGGQSFSGDFVVAARTARGPHPGGRAHRRLRQGHGRGLPGPAALRSLRRAPRLAAPARLPAGRQRLPAPPGLGRGVRHLDPSGTRPGVRRLRDLLRRPPARPPTARGQRPVGGEVRRRGPLLGVYDGAEFDAVKGSLAPGDVLMLFTDGLVEASDRDIAEGIDRLTGEADRYVTAGFEGAAWHLIEACAKDVNDDRALLLLSRRA
ncbi:serine/threonine-protein phosphatase [Streptomyces californicus]